MRINISVLVLIVSLLQVSAKSSAQKITITDRSTSLQELFKEIRKQGGYDFLYNEDDLRKIKKISVNVKNMDVSQVLQSALSGLPLKYSIKDKIVMISREEETALEKIIDVFSKVNVRGKVTDEKNQPLIGATVKVKGTSKGSATNEEGNFYLPNLDEKAVLVVSYTGFVSQEIAVNGRTELTIVLKEDQAQLSEVVVVGYGTQKKVNLTGAVSQINADNIAQRPSVDITGALQGLLPGLNIQINNGDPSAKPDVNIRGFNSINGGSPLVLVDGIEGNIARVNPNDIASVSVLKDAASAAIYGARGAFGVILITTKAGKSGEVRVNYSNNFALTTPTTRTDFISDPYVYGKTVDAALFGYNGTNYTGYNDMDWEIIKMVADGEIEPFHEKQANGAYKFYYKTNWYDYLFKKYQPSQYHNISVSGGTDKIKAYLSGRIYDRATIQNIQDADVKRYNLNSNLSFKPVKWLELSDNIKYVNEYNDEYGGYRSGYGGLWSTTTWYNLFPFYPNMVDGIPADIGISGSGGYGGGPAMEDGNNWKKFVTDELTNTFRVKITPFKGLDLNMDYSNRIENTSRTERYNQFDLITTDRLVLQTVGINRLGEWRWKDKYNALNIFGTYGFNIKNDHNFKLLLGYNQENFDRDRVAAQSNNLLVRDLANLSLGTEMYNIDGSALVWAVEGYFGRFNYDYKGKYLLEINARYDGSSRFPDESRWGFFPSVSGGWQLNRESFWEPIENAVSSMKLRASYGKLGNQTVDVNTFQQLMGLGQSGWLDNGQRINYASAPNPLPRVVTWETTRSIDFGVDLGVLKNRLMATFDWYQKETDGMYLAGQPLPSVFGAGEPKENYAALRNRGFELSLSYHDKFTVGGSPLSFSATASVSNFKGIITKYNNPQGLMGSYWEGQELGQIWGYHIDGQFQSDEEAAAYQNSFANPAINLGNVYKYILGTVQNSQWSKLRAGDVKYVDSNGDGRIDKGDYTLENHGDLMPIGNAMPKFPFGFNVSASWKNFDVSAAGAGVAKQNWYPTGNIFWGPYQRPYLSFIRKDLVENAWTPENPGNTYPQIYRGYAALQTGRSLYEMNDYYLENVGYMRVKNLTVGYTLPERLTKKINAQKIRVFFSGENLFTVRFGGLTKYIDPEQAGSAINYSDPGDAVGRADVTDYPMGKTYSMGINLTL
ncbi:TonB-dependent receptor [Arcticibacter tournemirensis]